MKLDNQLAAFIAGLFIGLMVTRHVKRKVVEVEVERTERGQDGNQTPHSEPQNVIALLQAFG